MRQTSFRFLYTVKKVMKLSYDNVYKIEHIADLNIQGMGYIVNDKNVISEEDLDVVFRITRILLDGKDITSMLPAIDDRAGIEHACRKQLIAMAWKNNARKIKPAHVLRLSKHFKAK